MKLVLGLFAAGNLANAGWMLGAPEHWFQNLPAGVPDTGPFNEPFVRDLGAVMVVSAPGLRSLFLNLRNP